MAFNWFRRKFSSDSSSSDSSQPTSPDPELEPTPEAEQPPASEEEPATAAARDYLAWAKAAYKNIQARQGEPSESEPSESEPSESEPSQAAAPEPLTATTSAGSSVPPDQATAIAQESTPTAMVAAESTPEETPIAPTALVTESDIPPQTSELEAVLATPAMPETSFASGEPESSPEPEPVSLTTAEPVSQQPTIPEPTLQAAILEPVLQEPAASSEPSPLTAESAPEESPSSPSLPFWARAEAERLSRLERLKAEAKVEPAVEPVVPPAPEPPLVTATVAQDVAPETVESEAVESETVEPETAVAFDEGFLWSAEVLAAQGRRPEEISLEEITWLQKLRRGLGKTRRGLVNQLKAIVGKGPLSADSVGEIESLLLQADVGVEATDTIIEALQKQLRQEALPPDAAIAYLKQILRGILDRPLQNGYSPNFAPEKQALNIWLLTGVNGVGKTTTIGKIAHVATTSGYKCLIGAADTFRAAAVEQVKIWGQRSQVEVIANPGKNTDPAAVVFDAIAAAQSREVELLLVDTAGRLQNKQNLMEELRKIRRILDKKAPNAQVESLLVLDATLGQNGLRQAQVFAEAAQLTGVVITKLDGTAKGGVALAVVQQLGLPIRFIGAGEGIEDLRPFSSYEFVEALLSG